MPSLVKARRIAATQPSTYVHRSSIPSILTDSGCIPRQDRAAAMSVLAFPSLHVSRRKKQAFRCHCLQTVFPIWIMNMGGFSSRFWSFPWSLQGTDSSSRSDWGIYNQAPRRVLGCESTERSLDRLVPQFPYLRECEAFTALSPEDCMNVR